MSSVFKTPPFFRRIVVLGSGSVANRAPLLMGEILRKCEDTIRLSRTFFSRADQDCNRFTNAINKVIGAFVYNVLLPISIFRSQLVFVLPSNNGDLPVISFWAKLFNRPILLDYYVSLFEWSCLMMKKHEASSKIGKFYLKSDRIAYDASGVIHYCTPEWHHIGEVIGKKRRTENFFRLPLYTNFDSLVAGITRPSPEQPFVFGWWGSSMPLHGLEKIVEAFVMLAAERTDFELHLCFWGEARRMEFERGRDLSSMPWLIIHDDLIAADGSLPRFVNERVHIGFSHFGTGSTAEYVYTNKVIECMSLGRTAIVADLPGNHDYGNIHDLFFVCPPDSFGILSAAKSVLSSKEELFEKEKKCMIEYRKNFSEAAARKKFSDILDEFYSSWVNQ